MLKVLHSKDKRKVSVKVRNFEVVWLSFKKDLVYAALYQATNCKLGIFLRFPKGVRRASVTRGVFIKIFRLKILKLSTCN